MMEDSMVIRWMGAGFVAKERSIFRREVCRLLFISGQCLGAYLGILLILLLLMLTLLLVLQLLLLLLLLYYYYYYLGA